MKYDTSQYRKHKRPGEWGSPCPDEIDNAAAQALLHTSVPEGKARYNVEGSYCYRAFSHGTDADGHELWHGHPIPWTRLPTAAKRKLIDCERLDSATYRKAIRKAQGREFGQ